VGIYAVRDSDGGGSRNEICADTVPFGKKRRIQVTGCALISVAPTKVPKRGTSLVGATDISRYYSSLSAHSSPAQAQLAIQVCLISAELWRFYHLSIVGFSDSDSPARCMHS